MSKIRIPPVWRDPYFWCLVILAATVAFCIAVGGCGCSSSGGGSGGDSEYTPPETPLPPAPAYSRTALIVGVGRTKPGVYRPGSLDCSDCADDAVNSQRRLTDKAGVASCLLVNEQATRARVKAEAKHLILTADPGGLVCFIISCHGGQRRDQNGDEADGWDEYLCLYDGALLDDELWALWLLRDDIRIWPSVDTCNAGSMFKAIMRADGVAGAWKMDDDANDLKSQLIYFGASTDGTSAYNGVYTPALIRGIQGGVSYVGWGEYVRSNTANSQIFTYDEAGPVTDAFRHGQALW